MSIYCREVQERIETRIKKTRERCKRKKCKWWCACCNKWFCWLETYFLTVVSWPVRIVCEVIDGPLNFIGLIVGIIQAIPIIGRIIQEYLSTVKEFWWRIFGLPGTLADIIGWEWTKRLRINIVILSTNKGPVITKTALAPTVANAQQIYRQFKIKLIIEDIRVERVAAPSYVLDVHCDGGAFGDDLTLAGSWFEIHANEYRTGFEGNGRRLIGYGGPITVFVVRDVADKIGCSLGFLSDYVTIEGGSPRCLAHELGHACGWITHSENSGNLMYANCGGTRLTKWQRIVIRSSRHVTYF
jgi:hypothetical protein